MCVAIKERKKENIKGRIKERERERRKRKREREEEEKKMIRKRERPMLIMYTHPFVQEAPQAQPAAGVARGL